jgi:NAD(P)H-hydrate repair Nnr-like enzyme with NAD(P)H-hydrate epimerase domain
MRRIGLETVDYVIKIFVTCFFFIFKLIYSLYLTAPSHHHQTAVLPKNSFALEPARRDMDDFDFQASLARFDKQRVFQEIALSDTTDPELLLVSHNRMKRSLPDRKLGIREMVLDPLASTSEDAGADGDPEASYGDSEADSVDGLAPTVVRTPAGGVGRVDRPVFLSPIGFKLPGLMSEEMQSIEARLFDEYALWEEMIVETGGRAVATLVMQALGKGLLFIYNLNSNFFCDAGGSRRLKHDNHNGPPTVVVLAGQSRAGAYSLCGGRNLANHGVNVFIHVLGGADEFLQPQFDAAIASGAKPISESSNLPSPSVHPIDLIIDGIAGQLGVAPADRIAVGEVVRWANTCKANKLSLEIPTGLHVDTGIMIPVFLTYNISNKSFFFQSGLALSPNLPHIKPRWTLSFGMPVAGISPAFIHGSAGSSSSTCGEIFLADVGFPRQAYQV